MSQTTQQGGTVVSRRHCIRTVLMLGAGLLSGLAMGRQGRAAMEKTRVVIVRTDDRKAGVARAVEQFDLTGFRGASVALKANFNSADPFPASTHPDTLRAVIDAVVGAGARAVTMAERSGMGDTEGVLDAMGAAEVCRDTGTRMVVMDDLAVDGYVHFQPEGSHWKRGFLLARPFAEAEKVVQTCCLKTHRYGGHFTMSLKNAVGAVAKIDPGDGYNYMSELHRSKLQRTLIPEISLAFRNDLIVMDGLKAFVNGGPDSGNEVAPGVIVAGTDPVAVDAVGVAILRLYGTTPEVSKGPVAGQEQLRRAAELGIGTAAADAIELVALGDGADEFADRIRKLLAAS